MFLLQTAGTASCHVTSGLRDRQLLLLSPWRWPMLSGPRARPGPHLSARMLLVTGHARRALVHERPAPLSRGGTPLRCNSQSPSGVSLTLPSGRQAAWRHTPRRPPPLVCLCATSRWRPAPSRRLRRKSWGCLRGSASGRAALWQGGVVLPSAGQEPRACH